MTESTFFNHKTIWLQQQQLVHSIKHTSKIVSSIHYKEIIDWKRLKIQSQISDNDIVFSLNLKHPLHVDPILEQLSVLFDLYCWTVNCEPVLCG